MSSKPVSRIEGKLVAETEKAVRIRFKSGKEYWIPKSTIRPDFVKNFFIDQKKERI